MKKSIINNAIHLSSNICIAVLDQSLKLHYFNKGFEKFFKKNFGIQIEQGQFYPSIFPSENYTKSLDASLNKCITTYEKECEGDCYVDPLQSVFDKKEKDFYLKHSVDPITSEEGKIQIVISVEEVTSKIKSEERMKELEMFFNVSNDLMAVSNFQNFFEEINPRWSELLGYDRDYILNHPFTDFVHPEDLTFTEQEAQELYTIKNKANRFENRYITKDNKVVWLEWNSTTLFDRQRNYSIARDVTEFKTREILQNKILKSLFFLSGYSLTRISDFDRFISRILEEISITLDVERVSFWEFIDNENSIKCRLISENNKVSQSGAILSRKDAENYFDALSGTRTVSVKDIINDPITKSFSDTYSKPLGIKSLLDIQVVANSERIGIICVESTSRQREWNFDEMSYVISVSEMVSSVYSSMITADTLKALSESEALFKSFTNNTPAYTYIKDENGKYLHANDNHLNDLNYSLHVLMGKTVFEIFDKPHAEKFHAEDLQVIKEGQPLLLEYSDPMNSVRWLREFKFPIYVENGPKRIGGIIFDITEQKNRRLKLEKVNNQLTLANQTGKLGVWEFDVKSNKLSWNDQMYDIYEISNEDFDGSVEMWQSTLLKEDLEHVDREFLLILEGQKINNIKFRINTPSGEKTIYATGAPVRDDDGNVVYAIGINMDFTDQIRKEKKLDFQNKMQDTLIRISSNYINLALDDQNEAICISLNEMGEFIVADAAYIYNSEQGLLQNWTRKSSTEIRRDKKIDLNKNINQTLMKGQVIRLNRDQISNENSLNSISNLTDIDSIILVPMLDERICQGFIVFEFKRSIDEFYDQKVALLKVYSELLVNINRRSKDQADRNKMLSMTLSQNQKLKDYSFITSHNLRSSIANILGLTHILKMQYEGDESVELLKKSSEALDKSLRTVNELITSDNLSPNYKKVSINEIIDRCLHSFAMRIKESAIEVEFSAQSDIYIKTIPVFIESVITNVISNAFKYGINETNKKVYIELKKPNRRITLTIQDWGRGMDLDVLGPKLYQLGSRFHDVSEGNGIGMFLIKNHMDQLGGKIDIQSEVGKGTTIKLMFDE